MDDDLTNMEVPESAPLDGWGLEIPDDGNVCEFRKPDSDRFGMPSLKFLPEVWEWCQENMRHSYFLLGPGFDPNTHTIRLFFTDETDLIHFRMRWG